MGRRMPYSYLFTRMRSPFCRVGSMDPDGILKGSNKKERSRKTTTITGKKLAQYSTHQGGRLALSYASCRKRAASALSSPAMDGSMEPMAATAEVRRWC